MQGELMEPTTGSHAWYRWAWFARAPRFVWLFVTLEVLWAALVFQWQILEEGRDLLWAPIVGLLIMATFTWLFARGLVNTRRGFWYLLMTLNTLAIVLWFVSALGDGDFLRMQAYEGRLLLPHTILTYAILLSPEALKRLGFRSDASQVPAEGSS